MLDVANLIKGKIYFFRIRGSKKDIHYKGEILEIKNNDVLINDKFHFKRWLDADFIIEAELKS